MNTLISSDMVVRTEETGFTNLLNLSSVKTLKEPDILMIEPVFTEFEKASNDQLGVPFMLSTKMEVMPYLLGVNISYSKRLAVTAKGYLRDIVDHFKGLGYPNFTSMHVPYETYGSPMVGSVLVLLFCQGRMAFMPKKKLVFPAQVFPGLLYHATAGRQGGSVYAGTADMNGFYNSNRHFLPDISSWAEQGLRAEYREGDTSIASGFKVEDRNHLFGVSQTVHGRDLILCTPAIVLQSIATGVKLLDKQEVAVAEAA